MIENLKKLVYWINKYVGITSPEFVEILDGAKKELSELEHTIFEGWRWCDKDGLPEEDGIMAVCNKEMRIFWANYDRKSKVWWSIKKDILGVKSKFYKPSGEIIAYFTIPSVPIINVD